VKIFIATPMYGGLAKSNYTISLQNLVATLAQAGHTVGTTTVGNESLITRARNTLAHKFLKTDFDVLLFIDADHGFEAEDVLRMLESDKDLIGAIYPMKGINWENVRLAALAGFQNLSLYSGYFASNLLPEGAKDFESDAPFKVKATGTGMMAIKRSVLEELKTTLPTYNHNSVGNLGINMGEQVTEFFTTVIDEDGTLLSEDYTFCKMWREAGNDVWAAPWVRITHSGDYVFNGTFVASLQIEEVRVELAQRQEAAQLEAESTEAEEKEPSE
jgi:hypothetical protein